MAKSDDLLVEIGTEELPPKALRTLMTSFADNVAAGLSNARLGFDTVRAFASPRRLAVIVDGLVARQADQTIEQKGPPVRLAFDEEGNPQAPAKAFAAKLGVAVEDLGRTQTDKGEWLSYSAAEPGQTAASLLPAIVSTALADLPIPRPMRWGNSDTEFVRPAHWVVAMHGGRVIDGEILGIPIGDTTLGHRFMAPGALKLAGADEYATRLEREGFVVADFAERRARVEQQVASAASACGGTAVSSESLLDEVAALVEWPVAITGRFDDAFLALPREVIVATLTGHQRYFPVTTESGRLLPAFVTVANLESKDPDQVRLGNERVVQPRLADAAFFWEADRKTPLAARRNALSDVVYQKGLGSVGDKTARVADLARAVAGELGSSEAMAERAAELAKCDLVTGLVGEFPELQGTMGRYYAQHDDEPPEVALALSEHYLPRFSGDAIAGSATGRVLAIADRIDTLCGVFALGKKPSGNRDPFGLRRAALGIVRTVLEAGLEIDLRQLIERSLAAQPKSAAPGTGEAVFDFIVDRLKAYYLERDGSSVAMFDAVRAQAPSSLKDFDARLRAVGTFVALPSAAGLAAANKRIGNLLRKAEYDSADAPDPALLTEDAETALAAALAEARESVTPLLEERAYTDVLTRLSELREPVDAFFEDVMVMAEDNAVRQNRLALLSALRSEFLNVADVSRLSIK